MESAPACRAAASDSREPTGAMISKSFLSIVIAVGGRLSVTNVVGGAASRRTFSHSVSLHILARRLAAHSRTASRRTFSHGGTPCLLLVAAKLLKSWELEDGCS